MNKRVKKLWIKALEGGQYKQTTGCLRRLGKVGVKPSYCCLGVLTNLYIREKGISWDRKSDENLDDSEQGLLSTNGCLTSKVKEWAGLNDEDPVVNISEEKDYIRNQSLIRCNDNLNLNFKEIAAAIKRSL